MGRRWSSSMFGFPGTIAKREAAVTRFRELTVFFTPKTRPTTATTLQPLYISLFCFVLAVPKAIQQDRATCKLCSLLLLLLVRPYPSRCRWHHSRFAGLMRHPSPFILFVYARLLSFYCYCYCFVSLFFYYCDTPMTTVSSHLRRVCMCV